MHNLAGRVGRVAFVPVLAAVAVLSTAAPAVAAPTAPAPVPQAARTEKCTDVEGASICVVTDKTNPAKTMVSALIRSGTAEMQGALVVLEACSGGGPDDCYAQEVAADTDTDWLTTASQEWGRGVGYYRVNASWVDDKSRTHSGEVYPE